MTVNDMMNLDRIETLRQLSCNFLFQLGKTNVLKMIYFVECQHRIDNMERGFDI